VGHLALLASPLSEGHDAGLCDGVRHLPNAVSVLRAALGFVVAGLLLTDHAWPAFWVFVGAIITDLIDGWLARWLGTTGDPLGRFLDPFCDKVLKVTTWLALWAVGFAPAWLVLASVGRDVAIAVIWAFARRNGAEWHANSFAQVMTAYEGVALSVLCFHGPWNGTDWPSVGVFLGVIALALSAVAALDYLARGPLPAGKTTG
jgi:cardiolipin synthase